MKIGFLFPGQGSQFVGMGKDLYENYEEVRNIYETVFKITGVDVAKLTFESNIEELSKTNNTQIAILTMCLGILKLLENNNIKADIATGLSLGEYTSLIYGKSISLEDGIRVVHKRGEYMQALLPKGEWSMAAFLGVDEEAVLNVCNTVKNGFVVPVNYNCPGQIVVSGEKKAVFDAINIAMENGMKKVKELNTSGPFHTEKLIDAADALRKEFENIQFNVPSEFMVLKNIDGEFYTKDDDIKNVLYKHMMNPVRFDKCIQKMIDMGVDTFVEIGPGKTLTSFVKRVDKNVQLINIYDVESLREGINRLVN